MGIRQFCDLCGNTVTGKLTAFMVTESLSELEQLRQHASFNQQGVIGGIQATSLYLQTNKAKCLRVELCPHCADVWWDRVSRLTKDSDPS